MTTKTRILLVEDDRDLVESIRIVLQSKGYDVLVAHNAPRGLEIVESERPHLILLDVMMPEGTEGFHFVWNLRNKPGQYFGAVPIIVMSAIHQRTELRFYPDSSDGTYRAGEYLPVQDFIDKPVDPDVLLDRVRQTLDTVRMPKAD